jgi:hypothetical protein
MNLADIATVRFRDQDSGEEAAAIVRAAKGKLALCLSLRYNGDLEIMLGSQDFAALLAAFERAAPIVLG